MTTWHISLYVDKKTHWTRCQNCDLDRGAALSIPPPRFLRSRSWQRTDNDIGSADHEACVLRTFGMRMRWATGMRRLVLWFEKNRALNRIFFLRWSLRGSLFRLRNMRCRSAAWNLHNSDSVGVPNVFFVLKRRSYKSHAHYFASNRPFVILNMTIVRKIT